MMVIRIAARNLLRNRKRSVIVLLSILIGSSAMVFMDGINNGMIRQMLFNRVNSDVGHIQIHKKGYTKSKDVKEFIPGNQKALDALSNIGGLKTYSKRVISYGMLSSASGSSGINLEGIEPEKEKDLTIISRSMKEGSYLSNRKEILLSKSLAEKLDVKSGDKVVVIVNSVIGLVCSDVFRVSGIYETFSKEFDKLHAYVSLQYLQNMLGAKESYHEITIVLNDYENAGSVRDSLATALGNEYEVLSYSDLLPDLVLQMDLYDEMTVAINVIMSLALVFGIVNVMLMAVLERIKEFGVLLSIGMRTSVLFRLVICESAVIGALGSFAGVFAGMIIMLPFGYSGVNLGIFTDSLRSWGVGAIIYPSASFVNIISLLLIVPVVSVLGAIYPAYKAVKLPPAEAIRHI